MFELSASSEIISRVGFYFVVDQFGHGVEIRIILLDGSAVGKKVVVSFAGKLECIFIVGGIEEI